MSVDTAMSRVLEAEKEALAKLAESERRAHRGRRVVDALADAAVAEVARELTGKGDAH